MRKASSKGTPTRNGWCVFGTADPEGDPERQKPIRSAYPDFAGATLLFSVVSIPKKGATCLQAFAGLAGELPSNLDLVIAGPDQVGWVPELQSLAHRLGISGRVHWPGMLKGDVKWGAFRSAEALILPSHQENFGFVVAEAMACATPVLISNKVNIWREVEASRGGLVEADSIDGTRNLIRRFLALSISARVEMRRNARAGSSRILILKLRPVILPAR